VILCEKVLNKSIPLRIMSRNHNFGLKYLDQFGILGFLDEHSGTREASFNSKEFSLDYVEEPSPRNNPFLVERRYPIEHQAFDLLESTTSYVAGKNPVVVGSLYLETGEYPREGWKPMEYDFLDFRLDCPLKLPAGLSLPKLHIELFAQRTTEFVPIDIERRDRVEKKFLWVLWPKWKRGTLDQLIPHKVFLPEYFQTNSDRYMIRRG
jgi:hypothetical protein